MKSPKKVTKSSGSKHPEKKKTNLSDPKQGISSILDDEDDFDLPLDDDIPAFDDFVDDDDDDF
ncbi:MAG: hypothetical protein FJY21_07710 [Bacteroidetes bacterium]|nr:hypothetical protein [Bacteroidota bacterium]